MSTSMDKSGCAARSWRMAAYGGVVVAVLLMLFGGSGLVQSVIAGAVVFGVGGFVMARFLCPEGSSDEAAPTASAPAASAPAAAPAPEPAPEPAAAPEPVEEAPAQETATPEPVAQEEAAPAADTASDEPLVKPSKALPGQEDLATRKGTWRYEGNNSAA